MANSFGEVVDNEKLEEMERYIGKTKTQEDRAREAMHLVNEDGKNEKAANYVQSVKDFSGDGISTLCLLYNATGDTLYYADDHDWLGNVGRTPYPTEIGNGQWAAFLHVKSSGDSTGSEAAVVYRGKNKDGQDRDYLVAWSSPWGIWYKNKSYCDVGGVGYFEGNWGNVANKMENGDYSHKADTEGGIIESDIATGSSAIMKATIMTSFSD